MKRFLTMCAPVLAVLALSGAALADNGGGNGNNGTPPGQTGNPGNGNPNPSQGNPNPSQGNPAQPAGNPAQPAGNPAQPAAAGNGKSEAKQAEHKKPKPATAAKKAHDASPGKSEAAKSASHGKSAEAQHHVIICHATGSESNPYVVINISVRGWLHGHKAHHAGDKLLKDPAAPGEKGPDKSACGNPPAQQSTQQQQKSTTTAACPATATRTEQVLVGIDHATGSATHPFVRISPDEASAHLDKHADDSAIYETRTIVVSTGETCSTATTTGAATTASIAATLAGTTAGTAAATAAAAPFGSFPAAIGAEPNLLKEAGVPNADALAGGVAGVSATIPAKKAKAKGGVLGVSKTLGTAAVRRDLPFTGLPLWIAALVGAALLATGLIVRARARA